MKKITVVAVSTVHHDLLKFSIEKTLENTPHVEEVIVFSDKKVIDYGTHIPIKKDFNYRDYNYLMLKGLSPFIKTEFMLHIHPDGMAIDKTMWLDDFLYFDYIGAPWHDKAVGNGGFSLRSAKLLEALKDNRIGYYVTDTNPYNEDTTIARLYKNYLNLEYRIRIAPYDLAVRFSREMNPNIHHTFGVHGTWMFPFFLPKERVIELMSNYYNNPIKQRLWNNFITNTYTKSYRDGYNTLIDESNKEDPNDRLWS